tara:strand:+ start:194 stop:667 length:474 start_codon:yes stop_codon:yes gene_type:complete
MKEKIKSVGSSGTSRGTKIEFFTYLEITLKSFEVEELKERLNYERNVRAKRKYHHYPVKVYNDDKIRIEWKSAQTRVTPSIDRALELFAVDHIKVNSKEYENKDYRKTQSIDVVEIETRILDLVQKGNKIEAIKFVKKIYHFNSTEAKLFVQSLQDK